MQTEKEEREKEKMFTFGVITYNMLVYLIVGAFALLQATSSVGEYFYNKRKESIESSCQSRNRVFGITYTANYGYCTRSCIAILGQEAKDLFETAKSYFLEKFNINEAIYCSACCNSNIKNADSFSRSPKLRKGISRSIFNKPPPSLETLAAPTALENCF